MGEPGALMILGKHEDLGLSGQAPEGLRVQYPIAVSFETGSERICFFGSDALSRAASAGRPGCQSSVLQVFSLLAENTSSISVDGLVVVGSQTVRAFSVRMADTARMPVHGGRPTHSA